MKLYIKYMVSFRRKMLVKSEFEKLGISCVTVELGMVEVKEDVSPSQRESFRRALSKSGLELLDKKKNIFVEKIKSVIVSPIDNLSDLQSITTTASPSMI